MNESIKNLNLRNKEKNKPNILFLLIDSFRADKFYGNEKTSVTPNLDLLIKQGAYFSQTITTAPTSIPTISSLFTGNWPFRSIVKVEKKHELNHKNPNYINHLNELEYHTMALIPKVFAGSKLTIDFDTSLSYKGGLYDEVGKQIIEIIDKLEIPWFFFIHLFDMHGPEYYPEKFNKKKFGMNQYERKISALDVWLDKIINQKIDLDNTIVVITADHSTARGIWTPKMERLKQNIQKFKTIPYSKKILQFFYTRPKTNYQKRVLDDLIQPDFDVFDDRYRIPLLFVGAGIPSSMMTHQVRSIDTFPTIFDMIKSPSENTVDGTSLFPLIKGSSLEELPAYMENTANWTKKNKTAISVVGIRYNNFKYFRAKNNPNGKIGLYNLKKDPYEENNIAKDMPEKLIEMEKILSKIIDDKN